MLIPFTLSLPFFFLCLHEHDFKVVIIAIVAWVNVLYFLCGVICQVKQEKCIETLLETKIEVIDIEIKHDKGKDGNKIDLLVWAKNNSLIKLLMNKIKTEVFSKLSTIKENSNGISRLDATRPDLKHNGEIIFWRCVKIKKGPLNNQRVVVLKFNGVQPPKF